MCISILSVLKTKQILIAGRHSILSALNNKNRRLHSLITTNTNFSKWKDEINKSNALKQMPSLLKSYLRLGAKVGEGAFVDKEMNTIDILIMIDVSNMTNKYKMYYEKS